MALKSRQLGSKAFFTSSVWAGASWRDAWRREFEKRGWAPPKWCVRPFGDDKEKRDD